jgi:hypothetical protein
MRRTMGRLRIVSTVALVVGLGCGTTAIYPGPRRPENEVAVLVNHDTALDAFDDQPFEHAFSQKNARYEVLPGRHKLTVSLFAVRYQQDFTDVERSHDEIDVCCELQAGHRYIIGREGAGYTWRPLILDEATRETVPQLRCEREE